MERIKINIKIYVINRLLKLLHYSLTKIELKLSFFIFQMEQSHNQAQV